MTETQTEAQELTCPDCRGKTDLLKFPKSNSDKTHYVWECGDQSCGFSLDSDNAGAFEMLTRPPDPKEANSGFYVFVTNLFRFLGPKVLDLLSFFETLFFAIAIPISGTREVAEEHSTRLSRYATGESLLFDIHNDPKEQRNLLNDPGCLAVRNRLESELAHHVMESMAESHFPRRVYVRDLSQSEAFGREGWQRPYPRDVRIR